MKKRNDNTVYIQFLGGDHEKEEMAFILRQYAKERWEYEWRFARMLTRRWWNVGNSSRDEKCVAARSQAPNGFACLIARNAFYRLNKDGVWYEDHGFYLHHKNAEYGKSFLCVPGKYVQRKLP